MQNCAPVNLLSFAMALAVTSTCALAKHPLDAPVPAQQPAHQELLLAQVSGVPGGAEATDRLSEAYRLVRAGDDAAALRLFEQTDAESGLPAKVLLDAGYTAMRADRDAQAAAYFRRALGAASGGGLSLTPQQVYDVRRTVAEVSRTWGVLASVTRRNGAGVEPRFGAVGGGDERIVQGGVEAYWRPFGHRHGAYAEVFARGFGTLDAQRAGVFSGADSFQGGVGARWKPWSARNVVLSISRVFGKNVDDAWLAQAAYSLDIGGDVRQDAASWWTTHLNVEAGRYFGGGRDDSYAAGSWTGGRSWRMGNDRTVLYPHVFLGIEHLSADATARTSSGAGLGLRLRRWFREDLDSGPRSYADLTVQYRQRLSGDRRIHGLFASVLVSF